MHFRRVKKASTALDMGPLLDCVLQLLIFFMISSTFMSPKVRIDLPEASASQGTTDPKVVIVTAALDGRLFVNQREVKLEALEATLRPLVSASEEKAVIFRGDEGIPYRIFIAAMDAARRAGARDFDIAHTAPAKEDDDGP